MKNLRKIMLVSSLIMTFFIGNALAFDNSKLQCTGISDDSELTAINTNRDSNNEDETFIYILNKDTDNEIYKLYDNTHDIEMGKESEYNRAYRRTSKGDLRVTVVESKYDQPTKLYVTRVSDELKPQTSEYTCTEASFYEVAKAKTAFNFGSENPKKMAYMMKEKEECETWNTNECYNLGLMYADGKGIVKQNYDRARYYYEKACDGGNTDGCYNLAAMYYHGKGMKQDYFKAKEISVKACDSGAADSCYSVGILYENGIGVKQDCFTAKEFYEKACNGGVVKGCEKYATLNKR